MENLASSDHDEATIRKLLLPLTWRVNENDLLQLAQKFSETYRLLAKTSTEHFLTTPVTILPTGKERGKFLSIDVGGTNLRVGFIELLGEDENGSPLCVPGALASNVPKIRRSHEKAWPIEEHLKMDQAEDLFVWIGECIAEVITDALEEASSVDFACAEAPFGEELPLGITFSFPMNQTSMSEATLMPMGKGFAITSDLNLGKMLLAGYGRHVQERSTNGELHNAEKTSSNKKGKPSELPNLRIAAITNDTVATFASLAYAVRSTANSRVAMGLIVGTGTNATVPMSLDYLHPAKIEELIFPGNADPKKTVVINTEWTIRGTDAPLVDLGIKTKWDLELDRNSEAPGFQPFEYMTAGRYLGEIVRLVLLDALSSENDGIELPAALKQKNSISTRFLSTVVARANKKLDVKLEALFPAPSSQSGIFWTEERTNLLRAIARAVQVRSSALIAAAIVGLLDCVKDIQLNISKLAGSDLVGNAKQNGNRDLHAEHDMEELVVAYAGGTISQYPNWLETCQNWIDVLVRKGSVPNQSKRVVLREALDGGIIGAAVLAGMTDSAA
ncbi:actin-like ATPase domain-containing protein [Lepidopterella palustris CBS 459.81]|uniref:Phosphotransferase n=1 Tax=Lepidopterella palustris CBS 459.81 TaxID=1314670 RepID=A0A8E2EE87_9PEZI|nr:actin-like ATPase domain-containing protein [Lepidopterella palustris CBS 459.81]